MMKTILYTTDFSENARQALPFAFKLAQAHQAELFMLHVIPYADGEELKLAQEGLKELFDEYNPVDSKVKPHFLVEENLTPKDGVLDTISAYSPDLVVVGSKGAGGITEALVGSTTKHLIENSPSPILAVPIKAPLHHFKRILFTLDFHGSNVPALKEMIQIFKPFEPEITIVHVRGRYAKAEKNLFDFYKDEIKDHLDYPGIRVKQLFNNNIYEELYTHIKETPYDLMVMVQKKRSGFIARLFHNDLVQKMESRITIPLLSFSERQLQKLKA
jgi:nucleotide-binding universal stress UspA family protein